MATTDTHTAGIAPSINDLVATVAILGAYLVRVGTVVEATSAAWVWPLVLVTDVVLPLLAAVWLLVVPTYSVVTRIRERAENG